MDDNLFVIVEKVDGDYRERHYISLDKFIEMIKRRWPEMADAPGSNPGSPSESEGSNPSRRTNYSGNHSSK